VILSKLGVSTIAIGDHTGYLYNPEGFNPHKLQDYVRKNKSIAGYPGGKAVSREEFFKIKADIFAPCALENQVGADEARSLQVRLVGEGANGPCSPEGERILLDKGIAILPDVLANAGGVTVSYFEWVQNLQHFTWSEEEVNTKLEHKMVRGFETIWRVATERKVSLRTAAFIVAIGRVGKARVLRGL